MLGTHYVSTDTKLMMCALIGNLALTKRNKHSVQSQEKQSSCVAAGRTYMVLLSLSSIACIIEMEDMPESAGLRSLTAS